MSKAGNGQYIEHEVVAQLNKKQDLRVSGSHRTIEILNAPHKKGDVGNGSKAKIDFLTKYVGYTKSFVADFKYTKYN